MSFILFFRQLIDDVNILLENLPNLIMEEAPRTIIKNNKRRGEQVLSRNEVDWQRSHNRWTFCLPRRKEMVIIFCPSIQSSNPILKIFFGRGREAHTKLNERRMSQDSQVVMAPRTVWNENIVVKFVVHC